MATLRKPKMLKYPKKPKASASAETMQNYLKRVKEIDSENRKRKSAYDSEKKKREQLRRKIANI